MTTRQAVLDYARKRRLDERDVLEWWTERAAVREYDGGTQRDEAERLAMVDVMERWP